MTLRNVAISDRSVELDIAEQFSIYTSCRCSGRAEENISLFANVLDIATV